MLLSLMPFTSTYDWPYDIFLCRPKSFFLIGSYMTINSVLTVTLCVVCPFLPSAVYLLSSVKRYLILPRYHSVYFLCSFVSSHSSKNSHFVSCFIWLTTRSRVLLDKLTHLTNHKISLCMEPEISLPCSRVYATGRYSEPRESRQSISILSLRPTLILSSDI